ncbi:MAG: hypothetical protein JHD16_12795 [Solirubrobacteraceae bacterium]|nr:hypothetical protein [Solirubrobacteraceae bacterium]
MAALRSWSALHRPPVRVVATLVASLAVALCAPLSARAADPIGFKFKLSDGAPVECSWSRGALSCLEYAKAEAPGDCEVGGDVPGMKITARNAPKAISVCVDEGFHDWPVLRPSKTFKRGSITCRLRRDSSALTCRNRTGSYVMVEAAPQAA